MLSKHLKSTRKNSFEPLCCKRRFQLPPKISNSFFIYSVDTEFIVDTRENFPTFWIHPKHNIQKHNQYVKNLHKYMLHIFILITKIIE